MSTLSTLDVRLELVLDAKASTGECPTWSDAEQALYWVDIEEPALHRFDPRDGSDKRWLMPAEIASFALSGGGLAVAALRTGLFELGLLTDTLTLLAAAPYDSTTHRFNDGKCDAAGRFWVGVMYKPLDGPAAGASVTRAQPLYVYDGGELRPVAALAEIANGLAWSPDNRALYFSDSAAGTVRRFAFDLDTATVSDGRTFVQFSSGEGVPDGAAIDEEGLYWCALSGGGCVMRLDPSGEMEREIRLPVSRPAMCTFGGPNLDELYITTAASGLSAEARRREPLAGGLFRCRPGIRGLPAHLFRR